MNGVARRTAQGLGSGELPIRLEVEDFEIREMDYTTQTTTILLLDMSWSMSWAGRFPAAKRVALAMDQLIRSSFPRDHFGVVGFSTQAREIAIRELPEVSWDVSDPFTNLQDGLRIAERMIRQFPCSSPQIIVITDGQPTAYYEPTKPASSCASSGPRGSAASLPTPSLQTLKQVRRVTRQGITINTFMLDDAPELLGFVEQMTRINQRARLLHQPQPARLLPDGRLHRPQEAPEAVIGGRPGVAVRRAPDAKRRAGRAHGLGRSRPCGAGSQPVARDSARARPRRAGRPRLRRAAGGLALPPGPAPRARARRRAIRAWPGVLLRFRGSGPHRFSPGGGPAARVDGVREAGLPVVAWGESLDAAQLWIATGADRVWIPESGGVPLVGLRSEQVFVKDLLDKLEVAPEVVHIGRYKGAGELATRRSMSPEQREQVESWQGDLFAELVDAVARGRGLSPEAVRDRIDRRPLLGARRRGKPG